MSRDNIEDAFLRENRPLHTENPSSPPPDAFGPFRVLHQIGAGALGPVFRAFDPGSDRLVAVKLFRIDLAPERVHQLVAEFERLIAAGLAHPAIAAPLQTGIVGAQAYLAAEFVSADSLDIVIRDHGPAPVGHAIKVAAQLAGAIDYAAAVGISHGTLHPRDVLVSTDDTRLTGFGIAQAFERVGVAAAVRRPYSAPERIDNTQWGREADVFALAAISYEMLTGRRVAGPGADAADGLSGVPGVDLEMARAVFARALAADPALRFETALQFVEALKQSIDETAAIGAAASHDGKRSKIEEEPRLPLDEPTPVVKEPVVDLPAASLAPVPPPVSAFDPADLDLATAETERYRDVESAPAVAPEPEPAARDLPLATSPLPSPHEAPRHAEDRGRDDLHRTVEPPADVRAPEPLFASIGTNRPAESAFERSRSAMWPLVLALVVGLAIGFASGYGVGTRATSAPASSPTTAPGQQAREAAEAIPTDPVAAAAAEALANSPRQVPSEPAPSATAPPKEVTPPPQQPAPRAADEAESGRLLVRSTPEGARVYVDGRERGRTPLAVRDLEHGTHRVRVTSEGYVTIDRRVVVTARRPSQSLEVALGRVPVREAPTRTAGETFVGALTVDSRPTGAKVYLDGRLVGTTPMKVSGIGAGSHVVRLEHDGYRRWSSAVRVVAGEQNRVTASLEK